VTYLLLVGFVTVRKLGSTFLRGPTTQAWQAETEDVKKVIKTPAMMIMMTQTIRISSLITTTAGSERDTKLSERRF
jgi:peptidoglycan biosynthesis protein MviN/MurJ (putative lipid II flippase)